MSVLILQSAHLENEVGSLHKKLENTWTVTSTLTVALELGQEPIATIRGPHQCTNTVESPFSDLFRKVHKNVSLPFFRNKNIKSILSNLLEIARLRKLTVKFAILALTHPRHPSDLTPTVHLDTFFSAYNNTTEIYSVPMSNMRQLRHLNEMTENAKQIFASQQ